MNESDSRTLLDAISQRDLRSVRVENALQRYLGTNTHVIWRDALEDHELL